MSNNNVWTSSELLVKLEEVEDSSAGGRTDLSGVGGYQHFLNTILPEGHRPYKRAREQFEPPLDHFSANPNVNVLTLDDSLGPDGDELQNYISFLEEQGVSTKSIEEQQAQQQQTQPPPPGPGNADVQYAAICLRLNEIMEIYNFVKDQIEKVKWSQKQLAVPPDPVAFENISKQHRDLSAALQWGLKEAKTLYETVILHPRELSQLFLLRRELSLLETTLHIYKSELQAGTSLEASMGKCFAALVVSKQPFPKSVKKDSKLGPTDPIVVSLIKGPKTDVRPMSKVKATLLYEDYSAKKDSLAISNDTQELDSQGEAVFSDIRFPNGTRLKMVRLQFSVQVQHVLVGGMMASTTLESDPSQPFVIITNENQWQASAGILLKKDAFDVLPETTWPQFANTLQLHYLRATRQSLDNPSRVLSRDDLEYIFTAKFDSKMHINQKECEDFWEWFGKALHKIRHQKHFGSLWLRGFIYGFVSKPDAERLLYSQRPGSFVIRFSESTPGKLTVAYVKSDIMNGRLEIKHYMIDPRDKKETQTLPEFLADHENLLYWIQVRTEFAPPGHSKLQKIYEKHLVLRDYLARKESSSTIEGYEEVLE